MNLCRRHMEINLVYRLTLGAPWGQGGDKIAKFAIFRTAALVLILKSIPKSYILNRILERCCLTIFHAIIKALVGILNPFMNI
jgi:hypothetical protein